MESKFPIEIESFLASIVEILKQRGRAREIALILETAAPAIYQSDYDNWNGGTYGWTLSLPIDVGLFSSLEPAERDEAADIIKDAGQPFLIEHESDHLQRVLLAPRAARAERWREDAQEWLRGSGINNQGRVRSDNIASRRWDGLLFRSEPEILLYQALKARGVTFAPLPVFVRGGTTYHRIEPDFVVIKDGVVMVIEVDGDTYHRESPADAHARLQPLDHEGAKIERVKAEECDTTERARTCAERLLKILEKRIQQRA